MCSIPRRVQRKRLKGWRMPDNSIYVGRGSKWGNPYRVIETDRGYAMQFPNGDIISSVSRGIKSVPLTKREAHVMAVAWFCEYAERTGLASRARRELVGKHLCCWCKASEPCHADVLLRIAEQRGGA